LIKPITSSISDIARFLLVGPIGDTPARRPITSSCRQKS
jgi:hypothetical protein